MADIKGSVEQAGAAGQHALVAEQHPMVEAVLARRGLHYATLHHVAIDHVGLRWIHSVEETLKDVVAGESIACIHEENPVARGHPHAFVHRVIDALVGFADPRLDSGGMALDDCHRAVGGLAIDHHNLLVGIALGKHTLQGALQEGLGIVGHGDDGHPGMRLAGLRGLHVVIYHFHSLVRLLYLWHKIYWALPILRVKYIERAKKSAPVGSPTRASTR